MHLLSKFFCLKLTEIDSRGHLFVLSICTFPQNSIGACSSMTIRDRRYLPTQDVIYFETYVHQARNNLADRSRGVERIGPVLP